MTIVQHSNSPGREATAWRVREIVGAVAYVSGVSSRRIVSPRRMHVIVDARFVVVRIARDIGRSWQEIGRVLERDHSSVLVAYGSFESYAMLGGARGERLLRWHREALERLETAPRLKLIAPAPPPPAPLPVLDPQKDAEAAPAPAVRSRTGFVNRFGEIIVGPALNEVIEDRWHRQRGWKRP